MPDVKEWGNFFVFSLINVTGYIEVVFFGGGLYEEFKRI